MIRGFVILLAFQLVGEVAARGLALPAPGPVIGLALLVVALSLYQRWRPLDEEALAESDLGKAARGLLAALPLLFVPAGVGGGQYMGLLREQGLALAVPLAAALLIGAIVASASAVLVAKAFGAPRAVLIALAPKSITAGVAMAVTEALGGAPPLTAVLVSPPGT